MAQDPDIFNLKMRENPNFVTIRTTRGQVITKGECHFIADKIARSLLYKGFRRGDTILIIASDPVASLLSEFACALAGLPYTYIGTYNNRLEIEYAKFVASNIDIKFIITDDVFNELLSSPTIAEIIDFAEISDVARYATTSGTTTGIQKFGKFTRNDCAKKTASYSDRKDEMTYLVFTPKAQYLYEDPMAMMIRDKGYLVSYQPKLERTKWHNILNNINEYGVDLFITAKEITIGSSAWESSNKDPLLLCSIEKYRNLLIAADDIELDHMISYRPHGKSGKNEYLDILFELETKHPNWHCESAYSGHDYTWIFQGDRNDTLYNRLYKTFHISMLENGRLGKLDPANNELLVSDGIKTDYATTVTQLENGYSRTGDIFDLDDNGYLTLKGRI